MLSVVQTSLPELPDDVVNLMFSLLCRTTAGKQEFAVFVLAMAASGDLRILQWLYSKFEPLLLWNYKS
jgi:hypothetical protein